MNGTPNNDELPITGPDHGSSGDTTETNEVNSCTLPNPEQSTQTITKKKGDGKPETLPSDVYVQAITRGERMILVRGGKHAGHSSTVTKIKQNGSGYVVETGSSTYTITIEQKAAPQKKPEAIVDEVAEAERSRFIRSLAGIEPPFDPSQIRDNSKK